MSLNSYPKDKGITLPPELIDSFGRLRVSEPFTLFDSKQLFDNQPLYWDDQEVSGAGTTSVHTVNQASTVLGVAASTAGKRVRQTIQRFNYQPGKSQKFEMTGVLNLSGGGAGVICRVGAFDDENGIFTQIDNTGHYFVCRSFFTGSAVDTPVIQADWNGDKLDGSGDSGITLDVNKAQIFWFDMEWLGVGDVRLGYLIDGQRIICHTFRNANAIEGVYMSTPNLPLRYEAENDGTGIASTMMHICSTVMSEGGVQAQGQLHWADTDFNHVVAAVVGVKYAVVGIKLKTTHIGQVINMTKTGMLAKTNDNLVWTLELNPTVAGTFTYADHANSSVQLAFGATANTVTGGHELGGGYVSSSKDGGAAKEELDNALRLGSKIDGTVDEIVLCVRSFGTNAQVEGGIAWRELT